jgi:hypothetical protein
LISIILGGEPAGVVAAAEITGADLPHQVPSRLQVVGADTALAGVVVETARLGPAVEGENGIAAQGAEAHGGDIEDARPVGLPAIGATDADPQVMLHLGYIDGGDGVADPFVAVTIGVYLGTEGYALQGALGALVDNVAEHPADRRAVGVRLDQVLADEGAQPLHKPAPTPEQRIIPA